MQELRIQQERNHDLWHSAARKFPPLDKVGSLVAAPEVGAERIGGLGATREEVLTYACAMTSPEVYASWGTFPPSGLLRIGQAGCGKSLRAEALATRAGTAFLEIQISRLALEIVRQGTYV